MFRLKGRYLHVSLIKLPCAFSVIATFSYNISVMHGIAHLYSAKNKTSRKNSFTSDYHDEMKLITNER